MIMTTWTPSGGNETKIWHLKDAHLLNIVRGLEQKKDPENEPGYVEMSYELARRGITPQIAVSVPQHTPLKLPENAWPSAKPKGGWNDGP